MVENVFEYYYATDLNKIRLHPLTMEELCAGMTEETANTYLALVENLYKSYQYDVNKKKMVISKEDRLRKFMEQTFAYEDLIKYLYKQNLISDEVCWKLHKDMPTTFNFIEHPFKPDMYVSDSLDDFRIAFEYSIVENDDLIDLDAKYLEDCYGYKAYVKPTTTSKYISDSDMYLVRVNETMDGKNIKEASYWEVQQLLKRLQSAIENNEKESQILDNELYKRLNFDFSKPSEKMKYGVPKNLAEWYSIKRALEVESSYLFFNKDRVGQILQTQHKPDEGVGLGATLFIYKGTIKCHKEKHYLLPATAILYDKYDKKIEIDVEYCEECKKYMLNYTSFEQYQQQYGILIGKFRLITSGDFDGEYDLALESPLKLCGYNVSKAGGLNSATRHYILSKIIHDGIMKKIEVVHYLEHFINMNGSKKENTLALEKWCDDLDFVHNYNIKTQPKVYLSEIKKY